MVRYAGKRGPNLRILMVILAITAASCANADVGVKLGACRADVRGDSIDAPDTTAPQTRSAAQVRNGIVVGATLSRELQPWLAAGLDLLYVQKGATYTGIWGGQPIGTYPWSGTLQLDYLELPAYLRWRPATRAAVRPFLDIGFFLGVLLDAHFEAESQQGPVGLDASEFFSRVNDWDLGAVAGGGVELSAGGRLYRIEFRYTPGLCAVERWGDTIKTTNVTLALAVSA